MSTKDAVGNGNAAMKEAAMKSLSTEAADSAESSARRTALAGAIREPCMLNGHSSTKVDLEPGSIGKEPDVRAGSTARDREWTDACWEWHRHGACGQHRRVEGWITYRLCHRACGDGGVSRSSA